MKVYNIIAVSMLFVLAAISVAAQDDNLGYFDYPRVYVEDDVYMPVAMLGAEAPRTDTIMWNVSSAYVSNTGFKNNGNDVQRNLGVRLWTLRGSIAKNIKGTYFGISVPVGIEQVSGQIGAQPASRNGWGLGDIALIAKRSIWTSDDGAKIVAGIGVEFPTGNDSLRFDQSNTSTNAYYPDNARRLPLAWQPGSGSTDLYTSISYNKTGYKRAFEGILACKFNGKGDHDVQLGDMLVLSLNTTQALSEYCAASLGLVYNKQQNDSYPNAPAPGVNQTALAGTTLHGTTVSLTPSIRFRLKNNFTIGFSFCFPIVKPDNGLVPDTRWGIIVSL